MEPGGELEKLRRLREARAACIELFLDALVSVQTTPHRLCRRNRSVRLVTLEAYRRVRSGRVPFGETTK
jgi:hypothetical protein